MTEIGNASEVRTDFLSSEISITFVIYFATKAMPSVMSEKTARQLDMILSVI
jgi:hypothetical protein